MKNTDQIAYHQRAQEAVRGKIAKLYPEIAAGDHQLAPKQQAKAERFFTSKLDPKSKICGIRLNKDSKWQIAKRNAAEASGLALDAVSDEVDALAREAAHKYSESFYMHHAMNASETPLPSLFQAEETHENTLALIHKNHITNEIHLRLLELGFTDQSAFKLQGQMIRRTIDVGMTSPRLEGSDMFIMPARDHETRAKGLDFEIKSAKNYWQDQRTKLFERNAKEKTSQGRA